MATAPITIPVEDIDNPSPPSTPPLTRTASYASVQHLSHQPQINQLTAAALELEPPSDAAGYFAQLRNFADATAEDPRDVETGTYQLRTPPPEANSAAEAKRVPPAEGLRMKRTGLPIRFRDLEVHAQAGSAEQLVDTFGSSITAPATSAGAWARKAIRRFTGSTADAMDEERAILKGISGVVERGETLLVLGRPGSGVTTLLRTLACCWEGYSRVDGTLDYALIKPQEILHSALRSDICYMDSHDVHFPTLSAGSALETATGSKAPSFLSGSFAPPLANTSTHQLRAHDFADTSRSTKLSPALWMRYHALAISRLLGLSHALGTPVGNEHVRGLSGGERRRFSLAEILTTRASILALDTPTSGLDSRTAVDVATLLRTFAREGGRSVVAGLRQVGESVYEQFDKVIVLHGGREVYFGPASEAKAYFEQLGFESVKGQSTADFLCACTDPKARKIKGKAGVGSSAVSFVDESEANGQVDEVADEDRERENLVRAVRQRVPCTPSAMAKAWQASHEHASLMEVIRVYDETMTSTAGTALRSHIRSSLYAEKSRLLPFRRSCHYTVSYFRQVAILIRRQYALIRADFRPFLIKTVVNILLSFLVGTLFISLPNDTAHAFPKTSILFVSLSFNGYLQLAELSNAIAGRPVVRRQSEYGFYTKSALAIARTVSDLPIIAAQVVVFGGVVYGLTGMQQSLGKFLKYLLFVFSTAVNFTAIFRMFAAFSPSVDQAWRYCGITLNLLVVYAGYFLPVPSMWPWLRWIKFIDPLSYAYEAIVTNEFDDIVLECSPSDIVPRGPSYTDSRYQACSVTGSPPGALTIRGRDYIAAHYGFSSENTWRNLAVIIALAVLFFAIGIAATEVLVFAPVGAKRVFTRAAGRLRAQGRRSKGGEPQVAVEEGEGASEEEDEEGVANGSSGSGDYAGHGKANGTHPSEGESEHAALLLKATAEYEDHAALTWEDVTLWVNTSSDTRRLLNNITGYVRPGQTTALMGASGAGKTTLLNALAGRSGSAAHITGEISFDGQAPDADFYRGTGFVEQNDLHDDRSTVRESLEFSALLRQDSTIPDAEKLAYVETVLDLMELRPVEHAIVGTVTRGLSLEYRKRLSIAVELVAKPSILFLDEPTTGLDTQSAFHIVRFMRKLARTGLAVLATIHQPSAEIFAVFDNLLLLERGGRQVYFGKRTEAIEYFESKSPQKCEIDTNPAEFLIDVLGGGMGKQQHRRDRSEWSVRWSEDAAAQSLYDDVRDINSAAHARAWPGSSDHVRSRRGADVWTQTKLLTKRVSRNFYRDASFSFSKLFTTTVVGLVIGLSFFQVADTIAGMRNRMFSVFLILFVPPVFMNSLIFKMFALRGLWEAREKPARVYDTFAFCSSIVISEIPYLVLCGTIFFCLWYFMVGLPLQASSIIYTFVMVQLFFLFQSTWAAWITALAPTLAAVANLLPFFLVALEAFNGSLMPYALIPWAWRWLYWISPFQWYVRAMLSAVLHGQSIRCADDELVTFDPPPYTSCGSYADEFLSATTGYLVNPSHTSACGYCRFSTGDDFLATLNIDGDTDRWRSLVIFAFYTGFNIILIYVLMLAQWPSVKTLKRNIRSVKAKLS